MANTFTLFDSEGDQLIISPFVSGPVVGVGRGGTLINVEVLPEQVPSVVEALLGEPYVTLSEIGSIEPQVLHSSVREALKYLVTSRLDPNVTKKSELKAQIEKLQAELEALG